MANGGFVIGDWEEFIPWWPRRTPMGMAWMRTILRRKVSLHSGVLIGYIYQETENYG